MLYVMNNETTKKRSFTNNNSHIYNVQARRKQKKGEKTINSTFSPRVYDLL